MRFSCIQPINLKKIHLQLKNILIKFEKTDLLGSFHCECEGQINLKWLFEKLESLKKGGKTCFEVLPCAGRHEKITTESLCVPKPKESFKRKEAAFSNHLVESATKGKASKISD